MCDTTMESFDLKDYSLDERNLTETPHKPVKVDKEKDSRQKIADWLGRNIRIVITDGRTLIGTFLCTDQSRNVILGSAQEFRSIEETQQHVEPRMLGLAMVPGKHIISLEVDVDIS